MIGKHMQDAINKQINAELYSSYLYLAIAAWFERQNLKGFAHWMKIQAQEEQKHAMKFYDHLLQRGGTVTLTAVAAPPAECKSALAAFEDSYKHECEVSAMINDMAELAQREKDRPSAVLLQWFISEQVEEEASADEVVQKLRMIGDSTSGLFMLDSVLGRRGA